MTDATDDTSSSTSSSGGDAVPASNEHPVLFVMIVGNIIFLFIAFYPCINKRCKGKGEGQDDKTSPDFLRRASVWLNAESFVHWDFEKTNAQNRWLNAKTIIKHQVFPVMFFNRDRAHYMNRFETMSLMLNVQFWAMFMTLMFSIMQQTGSATEMELKLKGPLITLITLPIKAISDYLFKLKHLSKNRCCGLPCPCCNCCKWVSTCWSFVLLYSGGVVFNSACSLALVKMTSEGAKGFMLDYLIWGLIITELSGAIQSYLIFCLRFAYAENPEGKWVSCFACLLMLPEAEPIPNRATWNNVTLQLKPKDSDEHLGIKYDIATGILTEVSPKGKAYAKKGIKENWQMVFVCSWDDEYEAYLYSNQVAWTAEVFEQMRKAGEIQVTFRPTKEELYIGATPQLEDVDDVEMQGAGRTPSVNQETPADALAIDPTASRSAVLISDDEVLTPSPLPNQFWLEDHAPETREALE